MSEAAAFANERRAFRRKECNAHAWVQRAGPAIGSFSVPVTDLSISGVFLRSPVQPRTGESIVLRFVFAEGPTVRTQARVVRRARTGFACCFEEIEGDDLYALHSCLCDEEESTEKTAPGN